MSNVKVTMEQDERTGEWVSVTAVISGGRIHHLPTEWVNPDAEYVTTSDSRDDDREGQYEPDQAWVNYDEVKVEDLKEPVEKKANFDRNIITSATFSGESMECYRCKCSINLDAYFYGPVSIEYAQQTMVIDSMVHWYAHKTLGVTRAQAEAKFKSDDTRKGWEAKYGKAPKGLIFQ